MVEAKCEEALNGAWYLSNFLFISSLKGKLFSLLETCMSF